MCASVTKQYNLVSEKEVDLFAWKSNRRLKVTAAYHRVCDEVTC